MSTVTMFPEAVISEASGLESTNSAVEELSEEQLLMASPLLHGFSLSDKVWCEYVSSFTAKLLFLTRSSDVYRG
jgi:hypothetical protein